MNNKNHTRAKILTMIPVIAFVISAAILVPLTISYFSTGSDVTAVAIILAGTVCLSATTLPCVVLSVLGTVFAAKAKKEGQMASRKFLVIGIVELVVYSLGVIGAIVAVIMVIIAATR